MSQLKSTLASIQSTVVADLDTFGPTFEASGGQDKKLEMSISEARTADLEMAVLVQVSCLLEFLIEAC